MNTRNKDQAVSTVEKLAIYRRIALDALHAKGKATSAKIASKIRKETTAETTRNPEMKIEITAELVY